MTHYMAAVFRSRKETMDLMSRLSSRKIESSIINTPRALGIGCGISLRFDARASETVRAIVNQINYNTFGGLFRLPEDYI